MLFAMMMGLRLAYEEENEHIILETDNLFAYEGFCGKFSEAEKYELDQLKKRKRATNMKIEPKYVPASANQLATFLARNGPETRDRLHVIDKPCGRALEIWYDDMGLGSPWTRFIREDEACSKLQPWDASAGIF
ncbi:hypothetical protein POM88_031116 [Heracleum sosnowskyi]|uniref:RNase H type-1 domain-containing protein n=1 Tax=Heracleum sosnowskyi TaxID=360622 RepID=A0AAD8HYV2_9APIA|nr:hypothetical protein POM88_031116 [Heracleum sosnowskyi]